MTNPDDVKEKLYEDLHTLVTAVTKADKLIILVRSSMREWVQIIKLGGMLSA